MIVGGREFEDTPQGWRDAADHVEAIGFPEDAPVFREEAWRKVPLWSQIAHWFGRCLRCNAYSTEEGIGGRCIDCGQIHGWMTREELRRLAPK